MLLVPQVSAYIGANPTRTQPMGEPPHTRLGWLVCGSSPIDCVLVASKAQHRGKWEQEQMLAQYKCTVMGKIYGINL